MIQQQKKAQRSWAKNKKRETILPDQKWVYNDVGFFPIVHMLGVAKTMYNIGGTIYAFFMKGSQP